MAIPAFVGQGAGNERLTTGSMTVSKTGCVAGNLVVFLLYVAGTTGDWSGWTGTSNAEALDGTDNSLSFIDGGGDFQMHWGRVMADGTVSANCGPGASGEDVAANIYEFSGASLGTTGAAVYDGNTSTSGSATTTIADAGMTTTTPDQLALNFVMLRSAQAIGPFTGETGGDWSEAAAEYIGTTLTLQLQIAPLAYPATIDGGSVSVGAATTYYVNGKSLRPAVTQLLTPVREFPQQRFGPF